MNLSEALKPELENLVKESKKSLGEVKSVAIAQAWKILQLTIAALIQKIEVLGDGVPGKTKKEIAMDLLSRFYDSVFIIIDIPFVAPIFESIIHKYVKIFLMILVGSTIDAMVTTFKELGIFNKPSINT
jgi:hypothetical protein